MGNGGGRAAAEATEESLENLVSALLVASRVLVGVAARSLSTVEKTVTITQFRTLVLLETHHGIKLNTLADLLGVNASTAMRMIDRLLAAGLVSRDENPDNRREVVLGLTTQGRRVVRRVTSRRRAEIRQIVAKMPARDRSALVSALRAFAEAADEPDPSTEAAFGW